MLTKLRSLWMILALAILGGLLLPGQVTASATAGEAPERLVLAHYMACCGKVGSAPSVEDYEREIRTAEAAGIDGFAINFGSPGKHPSHRVVIERFFQAAERVPGFHLLLSFDRTPADEASELVVQYAGRLPTLRKGGKVVVSGWGQTPEWAVEMRDGLRKQGLEIFLVPHMNYPMRRNVRLLGEELNTYAARVVLDEAPDIDGFFSFGAGGPYADMAYAIRQIAPMCRAKGKLFMAGIAPFYKGYAANSRVFESDGFVGMRDRWLAAIETGTEWVQLATWNDWNEASYVQPFDAPSVDVWNKPLPWRGLLDHGGFLRASRYYIDWFKSGQPPKIEADRVFYFYQLHPKSAEGIVQYNPVSLGRPRFWEKLTDRVHLATFLTAPATATIRIGDTVQEVELAAGAQTASVPMSIGPVAIAIRRDGHVLAEESLPLPIGTSGQTGNFNYLSGELKIGS